MTTLPTSPPHGPRLASYDAAALGRWLRGEGIRTADDVIRKVFRHAFRSARPWTDLDLAGAGIGGPARRLLLGLDPAPSLRIDGRASSGDGSDRLVMRTHDGELIETVLIPGPARTTLCVSTQVGCARACSFCETGAHGLVRQLSAGEIVDQVRLARDSITAGSLLPPLSNLVLMGMGEPFDNLAEVLRALRLLTDDRAFGFAPSHVTVSTVGVADKLDEFFRGTRAELAVSLNAPDDERRSRIMPVNRRFSLSTLRAALLRALPPRRRVLFEYVLFDGFNDADADADAVAAWVDGIRCRVNVIPCNPGPDPALRPPSDERVGAFVRRLSSHGVTTLVRRPRGRDVGGACGQLAGARRLEVLRS